MGESSCSSSALSFTLLVTDEQLLDNCITSSQHTNIHCYEKWRTTQWSFGVHRLAKYRKTATTAANYITRKCVSSLCRGDNDSYRYNIAITSNLALWLPVSRFQWTVQWSCHQPPHIYVIV